MEPYCKVLSVYTGKNLNQFCPLRVHVPVVRNDCFRLLNASIGSSSVGQRGVWYMQHEMQWEHFYLKHTQKISTLNPAIYSAFVCTPMILWVCCSDICSAYCFMHRHTLNICTLCRASEFHFTNPTFPTAVTNFICFSPFLTYDLEHHFIEVLQYYNFQLGAAFFKRGHSCNAVPFYSVN